MRGPVYLCEFTGKNSGSRKNLMAVFEILLRRTPQSELQRVGMELQLHGAEREVNLVGCFI